MKNDLLKIINNYGVLNQLEYYQSELWELNEAIINREIFWNYDTEIQDIRPFEKHIAEEIADSYVMLFQFMYFYNIEITIPFEPLKIESDISKHLKGLEKQVHKLGREIIEAEFFKKSKGTYQLFQKDEISLQLKLVIIRLKQFQAYYEISEEEIKEIMLQKIDRQLKRIEAENENKNTNNQLY